MTLTCIRISSLIPVFLLNISVFLIYVNSTKFCFKYPVSSVTSITVNQFPRGSVTINSLRHVHRIDLITSELLQEHHSRRWPGVRLYRTLLRTISVYTYFWGTVPESWGKTILNFIRWGKTVVVESTVEI